MENNNDFESVLEQPTFLDVDTSFRDPIEAALLPPPELKENPSVDDNLDYINSVNNRNLLLDAYSPEKANNNAQIRGFDSSHYGVNFERYYQHPKFKKLGFNPYRDNESIYNQNSSWMHDAWRAKSQYSAMFGSAIVSQLNSWQDMFTGDFSKTDRRAAHIMEKSMAIGNSSRDSFGGSAVNFALNSAYTMGIITEIAMEELALVGITALSGGTMAPAAGARTAFNIGKASKALNNMFKSFSSVNTARKAWNLDRASKIFTSVAPMGDTARLVVDMAKGKKYSTLDNFAKTKKAFGTFYRDLREINAVMAESKLEAALTEQEIIDDLYLQYTQKYNKQPTGKDLERIHRISSIGASQALVGNLGGIYISNKIVLNQALKGITPLKSILRDRASMFRSVVTKGKDGKKIASVYDASSLRRFKNKAWWADFKRGFTPKNIAGSGLRYFSANLSEGMQEIYQESLQAGLVDHYTKNFYHNSVVPRAQLARSLNLGFKHLKEQDMALEVFMSGFLMGGSAQAYQKLLFNTIPKSAQYTFQNKQYKEESDQREAKRKELEASLQFLVDNPAELANSLYNSASMAEEYTSMMQEAQLTGNVKRFEDLKSDQYFEHIKTLIKNGLEGEFIEMLEDLKGLTPEELKDAFPGEEELGSNELHQRIDQAIERSEYLKERYQEALERFPNPLGLNKTQTRLFNDTFLTHKAWNEAVDQYVFEEYTLKDTTERLDKIFTALSELEGVPNILFGDVSSVLNPDTYNIQVGLLESEIKNLRETQTSENIKKADLKESLLFSYKALHEAMEGHKALYVEQLRMALKGAQEVETVEEKTKIYSSGRRVAFSNAQGKNVYGTIVNVVGNNEVKVKLENNDKTQIVSMDEVSFTEVMKTTADAESLAETYLKSRDAIALYLKDIIQTLAEQNNEVVDPEKIMERADMMVDYAELLVDKDRASKAINTLLDPYYFNELFERFKASNEMALDNHEAKLKGTLEKFKRQENLNKLLEELYDKYKVFVNVDELEALDKQGKIPAVFYEEKKDGAIEEIRLGTELYNRVAAYIDEYDQRHNAGLINKLSVATGNNNVLFYGQDRGMGAFGTIASAGQADLTLSEIFELLAVENKEVITLDFLIKRLQESQSLNSKEIEFFTALRTKLGSDFKISFDSTLSSPFSVSEDNVLSINPTLAASNYNAQTFNIFNLINVGLTYAVLNNTQETDAFTDSMLELKSLAINAIKDGQVTDQNKEILSDVYKISADEVEEFLINEIETLFAHGNMKRAALMILQDNHFARVLSAIPAVANEKPSNLLNRFIKAISDLIEQLFGIKNNTVLDEALNLVGNFYFDNVQTLSQEADFESLPPRLQALLQEAYEQDESVEKPDDIKEWVKQSTKAKEIIEEYNKSLKPDNTKDRPLTDDERQALMKLDYTSEDIPTKTTEEWINIIANNIRKEVKEEEDNLELLNSIRERAQELDQILIDQNGSASTISVLYDRFRTVSNEDKVIELNKALAKIFNVEGFFTYDESYESVDNKGLVNEANLKKLMESIRYDSNTGSYMLRVTSLSTLDSVIGANKEEILEQEDNTLLMVSFFREVLEINDKIGPEHSQRGSLIDHLGRKMLAGDEIGSYEDFEMDIDFYYDNQATLGVNMLIDVNDETKRAIYNNFVSLRNKIDNLGLVALSSSAILKSSVLGIPVSGETDILLLDKDNNVYLVDLKTSKISQSASVKENTSKQISYTKQLNTYRSMLLKNDALIEAGFNLSPNQGILTVRTNLTQQTDAKGEPLMMYMFDDVFFEVSPKNSINSFVSFLPVKNEMNKLYPNLNSFIQNLLGSSSEKKEVHSSVNNKVIYVSMSLQRNQRILKEIEDNYENVLFLDNLLFEQIMNRINEFSNYENFGELTVDNIAEFIYEQYKTTTGQAILNEIYDSLLNEVRDTKGTQTIVTSINRVLESGLNDITLMSNENIDYIVYDNGFVRNERWQTMLQKESNSNGVNVVISEDFNISSILESGLKKSDRKPPVPNIKALEELVESFTEQQLLSDMSNPQTVTNIEFGISDSEYAAILDSEYKKRESMKKDAEGKESTASEGFKQEDIDRNDVSEDDYNTLGNNC